MKMEENNKHAQPNSKEEGVQRLNRILRISPKWYRRIGLLVPRGAEAWYRSYRSDGTGTKVPIYTLSKGAVRTVPQGTPR